jgi:outer membrane receptor protein involved in Fe transport
LNVLRTGDRNVANLPAGVRHQNITLEAYVTNVFDERTPLPLDQALDITPGHFSNTAVSVNLAQPRSWGARLRYDFEPATHPRHMNHDYSRRRHDAP